MMTYSQQQKDAQRKRDNVNLNRNRGTVLDARRNGGHRQAQLRKDARRSSLYSKGGRKRQGRPNKHYRAP